MQNLEYLEAVYCRGRKDLAYLGAAYCRERKDLKYSGTDIHLQN